MTIIKKRGRIVRNIFVIDRYDAPLRVPTGCWEEMLSRMYSVWTLTPIDEPYVGYPAIIFRSESREVKVESYRVQLSCEMLRSTLPSNPPLPSNPISKGSFTNYDTHEAQTLAIENKREIRGHDKLRL